MSAGSYLASAAWGRGRAGVPGAEKASSANSGLGAFEEGHTLDVLYITQSPLGFL